MPHSYFKRRVLIVLLVGMVAAGCNTAVSDPPPPASPPTSAFNTEAATSQSTNPMVQLEAGWMCDVQRFAFADLEAMSTELAQRLEAAGLDQDGYDSFKAEMGRSPELRSEVLAEYVATCSAPS